MCDSLKSGHTNLAYYKAGHFKNVLVIAHYVYKNNLYIYIYNIYFSACTFPSNSLVGFDEAH